MGIAGSRQCGAMPDPAGILYFVSTHPPEPTASLRSHSSSRWDPIAPSDRDSAPVKIPTTPDHRLRLCNSEFGLISRRTNRRTTAPFPFPCSLSARAVILLSVTSSRKGLHVLTTIRRQGSKPKSVRGTSEPVTQPLLIILWQWLNSGDLVYSIQPLSVCQKLATQFRQGSKVGAQRRIH
jgi:hypothetical protein